MPLTKFQLRPGVVRETTNYINQGGWFDCNKVRFRSGLPETIGGWTRLTRTQLLGTCRSLHVWSTLDGTNYTGAGTNLKLYTPRGYPDGYNANSANYNWHCYICSRRWISYINYNGRR